MVTSFSDLKGKNRNKNLADLYTGEQTLEPTAPAPTQPYQLGGVDIGIDPYGLGITQSLMSQPMTPGGLPLAEPAPAMSVGGGTPRPEPVPPKPQVKNLNKLKPNPNTPVTPDAPVAGPVTAPAPETPDFNYLPSQAIIEKFQGARNALDAAKEANELANDPELTRAKANNDLLASQFSGFLATLGTTMGKDLSQQSASVKDAFKASNASMDAQLTQADRMAKEADLTARQAALGADEEKAQLDNLKQQIGITADKQNVQLNALKLVADSKSLQEMDSPVPEVQLKLLKSKGINVPPGTTNIQLKTMSEMLNSEMAYKNQLALENVRSANQEKLLRVQEEAKARQPKEDVIGNAVAKEAGTTAVKGVTATRSAYGAASNLLKETEAGGALAGRLNDTAVSKVSAFVGNVANSVLPVDVQNYVGRAKALALQVKNANVGKDANMNTNELDSALATILSPGATVGDIRNATIRMQQELKTIGQGYYGVLESASPGLGNRFAADFAPQQNQSVSGNGSQQRTSVKSALDLP